MGGWQVRQPDLGTYLWRSPDGLIAVTTNQGTLLLGDRHWGPPGLDHRPARPPED